jgi:ATP phosphoribosyltransferase
VSLLASSSTLTIALPKGRLADESLGLFRRAGFEIQEPGPHSRELCFSSHDGQLQFILVKPADVPIYVEYGVADMGVAGRDTILESQADVYNALDLRLGRCRMVLAGKVGASPDDLRRHAFVRVASKYPRITQEHFLAKGLTVEVIGLSGSVELAPVTGLAEQIVDLVETGKTLAAHGLAVLETLFWSSARLVLNRASHKLKFERVSPLLSRLREVVDAHDTDRA